MYLVGQFDAELAKIGHTACQNYLNKKLDSTQQTSNIQYLYPEGQKNKNPPKREIGVASQPVPADLPMIGISAGNS